MSRKRSRISVTRPAEPKNYMCYCTLCSEPNSFKVALINAMTQLPATFGVCDKHAMELSSMLNSRVRRSRSIAMQREGLV